MFSMTIDFILYFYVNKVKGLTGGITIQKKAKEK